MKRAAAPWDFPYAPVPTAAGDDDGGPCDVIVATKAALAPEEAGRALRPLLGELRVDTVIARAPLFWVRVRSATAVRRADVARALASSGARLRYVASATRGGLAVGEPLDLDGAEPARASAWRTRDDRRLRATSADADGSWFLATNGVAVDRAHCGQGAGTRLAVVDDDAAEIAELDLDAEVLVGIEAAPRATSHGALMVAWATASQRLDGVAPAASPRLYCIPKPGIDVVSLPLAVARGAFDGADVIVCATYVEGHNSPMLDDALEVAWRLGRGGRGAAVVLPTGREASSPAGSIHSSWSLAFGDAASDPRVFCVAPSARSGGWFLWRDRKGRIRPFANRGPAVRWLAPGDDIAYPFGERARLFHAESSGASAIAAGVLLLVLASDPDLCLSELDDVVTRTLAPVAPAAPRDAQPLADPFDMLPEGKDRDGHNAKHGYGRLDAARACATAADPIVGALFAIGDDDGAEAAAELLASARPYSRELARFAARTLAASAPLSHALRALLRHARLLAGRPARRDAQADGALARQVTLLLRALASRAPAHLATELRNLAAGVDDRAILEAAARLWPDEPGAQTERFDTVLS